MFATNLKLALVVLGTLAAYTALANMIPQIESEVPEELSFTGEITADQLVAAGEELYNGGGGCTACHGLGTRAPNLLTDEAGTGQIGARCGQRVPGQGCKEYLHASLVDPNSYVVEGYEPIMPDMSRTLSAPQLWALVAYLQSLGGEVTVTADDVQADEGGAAAGAAAPAPASGSGTLEPLTLLRENQCMTCHRLAGEGGPIGPPFDGVGSRLSADEIRESILDPAAQASTGYEALAGVMPPTFGAQLTAAQLEAVVRYLAQQR